MKTLLYFLFAASGLLAPYAGQAQATQAVHPQSQTDAYGDLLTAAQLAATLGGTDQLGLGTRIIPTDSRNVATTNQRGYSNELYVNQRYDATTGSSQLYNQVNIEQIGDLNIARLGQNGAANSVTIYQTLNAAGLGTGNKINFSQTGNGNKSTLTQQGIDNKIKAAIIGNENTIDITQLGNRNVVNAGAVRESGLLYGVTQKGDDHELTQISSTLFPKGYTVEMVGHGIKLTIEQSQVLPTIKP